MINKLLKSKPKAILFDMDGTMIDNMMVHHRAWQQKLQELGMKMSLEEVRQEIHGINSEILERLFGNKLTVEERSFHAEDKEVRYRTIFKDSLALIDGLDEFLDKIKEENIKMGVGTAAPIENVNFVLDNLQLHDYFECVFAANDVKKGKPNPEIYQLLMREMDVLPEECIIFEDTPLGAEAAIRSGAKTVVITTTHSKEEFQHLKIDAFISDYQNLTF